MTNSVSFITCVYNKANNSLGVQATVTLVDCLSQLAGKPRNKASNRLLPAIPLAGMQFSFPVLLLFHDLLILLQRSESLKRCFRAMFLHVRVIVPDYFMGAACYSCK